MNGKNAEDVGNFVRAMAELTQAKGWAMNFRTRTKKAWSDNTEELRMAAEGLAKANNDKAAFAAASKVIACCNRCHSTFKD